MKKLTRRDFLRMSAMSAVGAAMVACQPQTVVVEKEVEKVVTQVVKEMVKETVIVEGEAQVVEKEVTRIIEKEVKVEKVVTPTPAPEMGAELPVSREETLFLEDTANFTIFDSFNYYVPNGMDFATGTWQLATEYLWTNPLVEKDYIYELATGFEYNDDYTQMTIMIDKFAHWNDGEPFTSHDVKFTIEMCMSDPALGYSGDFNEFVDTVEAPDDHTVVLNFKKPNPRFHHLLACEICTGFPIVPKHIWEAEDPMTFKNNPPVATGPYKLKEVIPDLKMYVWERDENYWNKDRWFPEPKYVVFRTAPPADADQMDLENNAIDHAHRLEYPQVLTAMEANPAVTVTCQLDPCPRGMWINCAKYPLSLPEVRWALSYCLNRDKIAQVLWMPPTVSAQYPWAAYESNMKYVYDDVLQEYDLTFDPAKAAEILDNLGFMPGPDGIRVDDEGNKLSWEVITPAAIGGGEYEIASDMAYEAEQIGIELTVRSFTHASSSVLWDRYATGEFDITSHWLCGAWLDPYNLYRSLHGSRAMPIGERATQGNEVRLQDPEFDTLIDRLSAVAPEAPEAAALYEEGLRIYLRDLPSLPVVQTIYCMPWNSTYWKGWPTEDNMYALPFTWWHQFAFVVYGLEKA
jgi:peptide/nickel transport system substrate-binding protein